MAHTAGGALHFGIEDKKLAAVWDYQTSPLFNEAERVTLDFAIAAAQVPNDTLDAAGGRADRSRRKASCGAALGARQARTVNGRCHRPVTNGR
jgi:hypothetical protein